VPEFGTTADGVNVINLFLLVHQAGEQGL